MAGNPRRGERAREIGSDISPNLPECHGHLFVSASRAGAPEESRSDCAKRGDLRLPAGLTREIEARIRQPELGVAERNDIGVPGIGCVDLTRHRNAASAGEIARCASAARPGSAGSFQISCALIAPEIIPE